jgi:hypothetical protein
MERAHAVYGPAVLLVQVSPEVLDHLGNNRTAREQLKAWPVTSS